MLATFNEYHWSFLTCGAQISYKTNTLCHSVYNYIVLEINKFQSKIRTYSTNQCDH